MFNTPGTRAGRGRLVTTTTVASYVGDNSGNYTTSSASFAALGNFNASIAASIGDVIDIELTGTVLGAIAATMQYTDFGFFINGVDMGTYAEVSTIGNTVSSPEATVAFRARRTVVAADLASGLFTVAPKWKVNTGTVTWINASGFDGLLTLRKTVSGSSGGTNSTFGIYSGFNPWDMDSLVQACALNVDGTSTLISGGVGSGNGSFARGTKSQVVGAADVMFEVKAMGGVGAAASTAWMIGVATSLAANNSFLGFGPTGWGYFGTDGKIYNNGGGTVYGATFVGGDIIGVRINTLSQLTMYKNGVSQGLAANLTPGTVVFPACGSGSSSGQRSLIMNTGAIPFKFPVASVGSWG